MGQAGMNRSTPGSAFRPAGSRKSLNTSTYYWGRVAINTMNSSDLDRKLRGLVGDERNVEVEFLLHLDRFDTARGYELFGLRTLWEYCRQELNLLEGAIWRRTNAMVLLRRFPQAEARLRDGRLSMTSLVMLGKILTEQNVFETFENVVGKSSRQIEEIVAAVNSPRPENTVVIRKLPAPRMPVPAPELGPEADSRARTGISEDGVGHELATPIRTGIGGEGAGLRAGLAGSELKEKIEKATKILSHKIPDGDVQKVIGEAIDRLIRDDEKLAARDRPRGAGFEGWRHYRRELPVDLSNSQPDARAK